ncbi:MAG: hypothetical protein IKD86_05290 [Firmicutes bacterium]|nr:hypothetical protein [Bacillota bacterium]
MMDKEPGRMKGSAGTNQQRKTVRTVSHSAENEPGRVKGSAGTNQGRGAAETASRSMEGKKAHTAARTSEDREKRAAARTSAERGVRTGGSTASEKSNRTSRASAGRSSQTPHPSADRPPRTARDSVNRSARANRPAADRDTRTARRPAASSGGHSAGGAVRERNSRSSQKGRNTGGRKRTAAKKAFPVNPKWIVIVAAVAAVVVFAVLKVKSWGVNHGSAINVVKELISAETEGKVDRAAKCYGIEEDIPTDLRTEIESAMKYYEAHAYTEMKIRDCDTIFEKADHSYVYIIFHLVLENEQEYPCIETFMTQKGEGGYNVLPAAKISGAMQSEAAEAYKKFMTSDAYKNYTKAYDTFSKKNPGYEEKIAARMG